MGINKHERFESHMDIASPETIGDAEKVETFSDDPYDDLFDKRLSSLTMLESKVPNKMPAKSDVNLNENDNLHRDKDFDDRSKRNVLNKVSPHSEKFTMNSHATLEYKIEHTAESKRKEFIEEIKSSAVGGGWMDIEQL